MTDPATPTGYQRSPGGGFRWLPPSAEHLAKLLPQYDIERLLGHGGMGAVYQGTQKSLKRPVAIKILPQGLEDEDASYTGRFKNEAQILARLSHPCIVAVHDFGETSEGQLYIVMEFVDGTDVAQMISAQGKLPPEHALAIAAHVCDALGYAHDHGVVHRDIKPANILINREGAVKVADFGLAKLDEPGTTGLTKTGMAMGTPDYVAPEALMFGTQIDGRADLYAVGVMLYHMLTGAVPRGAFDLPSRRLGTDPRFDAIILKAMKMDRSERYQTSAELRRDLDVILTLPLVQAGGESSAAIPQSAPNTASREPAAPPPNRKSKIINHKSTAMIALTTAAAAVVIAGAFVAFKPSTREPQTSASVDESGAAAVPKWTAQSSVRSAEPSKATAQGTVRTTINEPPSAQPILVAQANTKPKNCPELQLGQSAAADPVPARKPDPAKWVKMDPTTDFRETNDFKKQPDGSFTVPFASTNTNTYRNVAIRAFVILPAYKAVKLAVRVVSGGTEYEARIMDESVSIMKSSAVTKPYDGQIKSEVLGEFKTSTKRVHSSGDVFTFAAFENTLTVWLGDQLVGSVNDAEYKEGRIGLVGASATFRDIEYQILDASSPAVAQAPTPAATPVPPAAPAPPVVTLPPELTTLQQQYDKLFVERVTGIYAADMAKLNTGYLAGLDRASATAQSGGELDTVLAITAEKKLLEAKQPMPVTDDAKTPDALKNLRTIYRTSLAKLDEQRTTNHTALLTPYTTRLRQIEADLTKAGRIPDAVAVKTYREGLGTNSVPVMAPAAVASTPATAAPPAASAKAEVKTPRIKGDDRKAAEWVLTAGGNVKLSVEGTRIQVTDIKSLPRGKFEVVEVRLKFFGGDQPAQPVTDLIPLTGLKSLEVIDTAGLADLKDEHLAVLSSLPALQSVWFTAGRLTDAVCVHIAAAPAVTNIHLGSQRLITGAGLPAFAKLKKLEAIYLEECTGLNEEGFSALASLGQLRFVFLNRIPLNDSQLAALATIKRLKELNVKLCLSLTDAGLAAFQKARPDVKVER